MSDAEKIAIYEAALHYIANFHHTSECCGCAPIYECGCYADAGLHDQWAAAKAALAETGAD